MTDGDQYIFTNRLANEKTNDKELSKIVQDHFSLKDKIVNYFSTAGNYIKTYF